MKPTHSILAGMTAAILSASSAQAADLLVGGFEGGVDPIYSSPLFNFEGFYVGATGGGAIVPGPGIVGTIGVVAGANFEVSDAILAGVEWQGDTLWNGGGFVGFDALFLG
jgi:outer membrane immunogenic protein